MSSIEELEADASYEAGKDAVKYDLRELIQKKRGEGRKSIKLDELEKEIEAMM